jgi:phosphoribosylanthranilate isomerase
MNQTAPAAEPANKRVRVKVCGLTSVADAQAAAFAGVDAIGLMFAWDSARRIAPACAAAIAAAVPPFVARVALFLDNDAAEIERILEQVPVDAIQFHGSEPAAFCDRFGKPYIKAVPMGEPGVRLADWTDRYPRAAAFLLDANRIGERGGQGRAFDWQLDTTAVDRPLVVAGGLTVDNVGQAVQRFAPYAVDVSSGVESRPGVKSADRMRAFVVAVTQGAFV